MSDNSQLTQSTYFIPVLPFNPLFPSHTVQIVSSHLPTPLLMPQSTFQTPIRHSLPPTVGTLPPIAPPSPTLPPVPVCSADKPISAPGPVVKRKRKTIRIPRRPTLDSTEYRIARLERKLAIFQASIEDAGSVELSLDDLLYQDNALLRLHKLERKAADIWEKICVLKGKSDRIMVMSDVLRKVNCTAYPAINERIERFFKRNILDLPDILDVSDMISKVNAKEGLSLGKAEITRLSKQVLQYVGTLMSDRRRADLFEVLKSRTDKDELTIGPDPLLLDPVFKARLEENDAAFKTRLKDTLGLYCEKQDALAANGETDPIAYPVSDNNRDDNDFCDLEDSPLYSPSFIPIETPADDSIPHYTDTNTPALPIETDSTTGSSTFHCTAPISKKSTSHRTDTNSPALPIETDSTTSSSTFHCTAPISKKSTFHSTDTNTPALPIETHSTTGSSTFHCIAPISKKSTFHSTDTNTPALPIETHSTTSSCTFHCIAPISKKSTSLNTYTPLLMEKNQFSKADINTFHCSTSISKKSASLATAPVVLESVPKRVKLDSQDNIPIVISSDED